MKYLENAIRFSLKNWMLILPLFILTALAFLLGGVGSSVAGVAKTLASLNSLVNFRDSGDIMSTIPGLVPKVAFGGGIWAFLLQFVSIPITYGLINKSLETGNASLNDCGEAISRNFVKYVLYMIGMIVVGLVIGIGVLVLVLVIGLLCAILKWFGAFLAIILGLALLLALIAFGVLISMWLSAMVVDDLDVVAAAKKSIEIVKSCFWTILGITILISIAAAIVGSILGWFSGIPLLGRIICSAVPTAQTFLMAVFLLAVYRDKTGKINIF
jgi:hypothetical protein